ncbi:MAG: HAD family hydrolase [Kiritimatiellia bacterium]
MKLTRVAFVYDFDGTLARGNIQENSFLPKLGLSREAFWKQAKELSKEKEMDEILAYMYLLLTEAKKSNIAFRREDLRCHGKKVCYFNGVETWFDRINAYAKSQHLALEHYIISSGTYEMIMGTSIAKYFKFVYASSFMYDANDVPVWPALAINYTTKTQYLFRINKGIENAWDNAKINDYMPMSERPIPFSNMVYLGDGLTDVPAMKMTTSQGGTAIGVYAPHSKDQRNVKKLLQQQRVNYVAPADYGEESKLDRLLKFILNGISARCSAKLIACPKV